MNTQPPNNFFTAFNQIEQNALTELGDINSFNQLFEQAKFSFSPTEWDSLEKEVKKFEEIKIRHDQKIEQLLETKKYSYLFYKSFTTAYYLFYDSIYSVKCQSLQQFELELEKALLHEMQQKALNTFTVDLSYKNSPYTVETSISGKAKLRGNLIRITYIENDKEMEFKCLISKRNGQWSNQVLRGRPDQAEFIKLFLENLLSSKQAKRTLPSSDKKRILRLKKFQKYSCYKNQFFSYKQIISALKKTKAKFSPIKTTPPPAIDVTPHSFNFDLSKSYWENLTTIEKIATEELQQICNIIVLKNKLNSITCLSLPKINPKINAAKEIQKRRNEKISQLNESWAQNDWKRLALSIYTKVHSLFQWISTTPTFQHVNYDFDQHILSFISEDLRKTKLSRFSVDTTFKGHDYTVIFGIGSSNNKFPWGTQFKIINHTETNSSRAEFALYRNKTDIGTPLWYEFKKPKDEELIEFADSIRAKLLEMPRGVKPKLTLRDRKNSIQRLKNIDNDEFYNRFFGVNQILAALDP